MRVLILLERAQGLNAVMVRLLVFEESQSSKYLGTHVRKSQLIRRIGMVSPIEISSAAMNPSFLLGASLEASRLSAEAMVGSFFAAAFVIVIPAATFLLWVSQKDVVR